jgi:hypothetical protein
VLGSGEERKLNKKRLILFLELQNIFIMETKNDWY